MFFCPDSFLDFTDSIIIFSPILHRRSVHYHFPWWQNVELRNRGGETDKTKPRTEKHQNWFHLCGSVCRFLDRWKNWICPYLHFWTEAECSCNIHYYRRKFPFWPWYRNLYGGAECPKGRTALWGELLARQRNPCFYWADRKWLLCSCIFKICRVEDFWKL